MYVEVLYASQTNRDQGPSLSLPVVAVFLTLKLAQGSKSIDPSILEPFPALKSLSHF